MRGTPSSLPSSVFRVSRDSHDVTTTPTLLLLYLNRKGFGEESGGLARLVCFILLLLVSFPFLLYLSSRLGSAPVAFSCASTLAGLGGGPLLVVRFERVLVPVLVWQSGSFRIFALPGYHDTLGLTAYQRHRA